ncbi:MAG TPA: PKD domain-containing protein [Membranihabitans sp.]|nr:PKD domain-containing protein [Membranihabitans sp.]
MKHYLNKVLIFTLCLNFFVFVSCDEEENRPTFPLSAEIFYSSDGTQVAFTALTHSAVAWEWDFGDGNTSTEQNPVHVYEEGGYYLARLTARDASGATVTKEVTLALDLTPYAMLTGDYLADNYDGKTWKLTAAHSAGGDYFANADAEFSVVSGTPAPLPTGIFDLEFGMGDVYKDEYTFYFDGRYRHDVKEDGAAFGGIVYQFVLNGGAGIVNANGADYGLCIAQYTPEENATFTFTENENFTIPSVYGPGGQITYENVMTLDFSGTEFIGFRDFQRKVILNKITNDSMQLIMFMAAAQQAIGVNTHALFLSFEVVD